MNTITAYAPQITILDNVVNMIDGLYSLKDLHKASGGDNKHAPFRFMRNAETKELIAEIERSPDMVNGVTNKAFKVVQGGTASKQGTYACKDLVYRYAMWISPKFALLVIRTFDKLVTGELKVQPAGLSTVADRKPLSEAVNMYCAKTGSIHSDVWKLVHQRFALDDVYGMTVEQVPQAVEYVHSLLIQARSGSVISEGMLMNNRMWKDVGFVKTEQVCIKTRELSLLLAQVDEKVREIKRAHVIIFDSFSGQKWNGLSPEQLERVDKQGKLFY